MSPPQIYHSHRVKERVRSSVNRSPLPLRLASGNPESGDSPRRVVKVIPSKMLSSVLLILGAVTLLFSIVYSSSILALIGLGLLFFGIIFTYFSSDEYVKKVLLDTTVSSQQAALENVVQKLGCKGEIVYLPPKYLTNPELPEVFMSKRWGKRLPKSEQPQRGNQGFLGENMGGLRFTPPGAELLKLFEKKLGTNFISVDLQYLQQNMPKLFIEELEIAQDFELTIEDDKIRAEIQDSIYGVSDVGTEKFLSENPTLGAPLGSAIACALAKAMNKPIVLEKEQTSRNGKNVTFEFRTIEEEA